MKTLYFKNTLTGRNSAHYLLCLETEYNPDNDLFLEVQNIPDNIENQSVQILVNQTGLWKTTSIDYSQLGEEKLVKWGGKREGAGRTSTGRKRQQYYVTDAENEQIKNLIEQLRNPSN